MKRSVTSAKLPSDFPRTPEERAAAIARASRKVVAYDPKTDAYDPNDPQAVEAFWKDAVVTHGSPEAVRAALAAKRGRGPGKRPAKTLVSLRIPQDTLARWKATGPGWQTRMAEVLDRVQAK